MRFKITVCHKDDIENSWEEPYDEDTKDPQTWAKDTIKRFNSCLHPGDRERILLDVKVIDNQSIKNHDWRKQNLVTIAKPGAYHDILKCGRCGITAKRYGVDRIVLDSKFRAAKVYQRCDTSLVHIKKLKKQRSLS